MEDIKVKVPEDMVKAAYEATYLTYTMDGVRRVLVGALSWLRLNPIAPTGEQVRHLQTCGMLLTPIIQEWQRIAFLAPEEEIPEELKPLLYDEATDGWRGINADILEAYRLGQKAQKTELKKPEVDEYLDSRRYRNPKESK